MAVDSDNVTMVDMRSIYDTEGIGGGVFWQLLTVTMWQW